MNEKWLLKMSTGIGVLFMPSILWANAVGMVNVNSLNVRKAPTISSEQLTKVKNGEQLEVIESSEGWCKIKLASGQMAYVKEEFLKIVEVQGTVKVNHLNLRSYPQLTKSRVMSKIPIATKVKILYQVEEFYKIAYDGNIGFVYAAYIDAPFNTYVVKQQIEKVQEIPVTLSSSNDSVSNGAAHNDVIKEEIKDDLNNSNEVPQAPAWGSEPERVELEEVNGVLGSEIVNYALQFLGNPYRYGGNDLITGVDCSGFTQQVMKQFNIAIPRTSKAQSTVGKSVNQSQIQQGDLIFFGSSLSNISHVGIYMGEGQMIHSSTPETGIIISGAFYSGGNPIQVIRRMN